jgi:hypothetical protein
VFRGVRTLQYVALIGSPLSPAVVEALEPALTPGVQIVSAALARQKFGRFAIVAEEPDEPPL